MLRLLAPLVLASTFALPSPALAFVLAAPAEDEDFASVFLEGQQRAERDDHVGAVGFYEKAFQLLPENGDNHQRRILILSALVHSQIAAHASTGEVRWLYSAKKTVSGYLNVLKAVYGKDANNLPGTAEGRRLAADVVTKMEGAGADPDAPPPDLAEEEPAEEAETQDPAEATEDPDEEEVGTSKPGLGLIVGGAVAAGLGVGAIGLMGFGLARGSSLSQDYQDVFTRAERDSLSSQGKTANTLAVVGGVAGGVLLGAGAALIVIGLKKRKGAATPTVSALPLPGGAFVGVGASF
jgi:hypothetical protein